MHASCRDNTPPIGGGRTIDPSARRSGAVEVAPANPCAATGPTDRQPTIRPAACKREGKRPSGSCKSERETRDPGLEPTERENLSYRCRCPFPERVCRLR